MQAQPQRTAGSAILALRHCHMNNMNFQCVFYYGHTFFFSYVTSAYL